VGVLEQAGVAERLDESAVAREHAEVRRGAHEHDHVAFSVDGDPGGVPVPARSLREPRPGRVDRERAGRLRGDNGGAGQGEGDQDRGRHKSTRAHLHRDSF